MNKIPRNWLIAAILLTIGLLAILGWRQWGVTDQVETAVATEPSIGEGQSVSTIAATQHFTFTLPAGWIAQPWQRDELVASSETLGQQLPRLRDSLSRLLAAFQPESQLLILQPEVRGENDAIILLLSIPSHGLRLEQIARQFANQTALPRVIDTSLRHDGQPILRIRGEQLTGLDSRATYPKQIAIINHYYHDELIVMVEIQPNQQEQNLTESTLIEDILRSIELFPTP